MNNKKLELMADRIDAVLDGNKIKVRVNGGIVTPRTVIFNVSESLPGGNGLAVNMALALGVPSVTIAGRTITVKRDGAKPISLLALLGQKNMSVIPAFTATLGMCDDGAPLLLRLLSGMVGHVLVSGAGAACLLRTIAVSLAVCNRHYAMRLVLVGREFGDLARLPHVQDSPLDNIVRLVGRSDISPRVVILIDDLDMHDSNLERILQDGHSSGIHVIAAGNGSSAGFSTIIKSAGEPGDFIALSDGQEVRFTAANISPAEVEQVMMGTLPQKYPTRLSQAAKLVSGTM